MQNKGLRTCLSIGVGLVVIALVFLAGVWHRLFRT